MNINEDLVSGRQRKVRGCARLTSGEQAGDEREATLGQLEFMTGVMQQRRGLVMWRLERARQRLAPTTIR